MKPRRPKDYAPFGLNEAPDSTYYGNPGPADQRLPGERVRSGKSRSRDDYESFGAEYGAVTESDDYGFRRGASSS